MSNPTGKGGFQERPQDRGSWTKNTSPTRFMRKYGQKTKLELEDLKKDPRLSSLELIAINMLLAGVEDPAIADKIIDRLDGRAKQTIDTTIKQIEPPQFTLKVFDDEQEDDPDDTKEHD